MRIAFDIWIKRDSCIPFRHSLRNLKFFEMVIWQDSGEVLKREGHVRQRQGINHWRKAFLSRREDLKLHIVVCDAC